MANNAKTIINGNPISGSICETCDQLIKRVIQPFDEAEFGIDREELDIPDDEDVFCEHYFCKEMLMDLDHLVITCNKYVKTKRYALINNAQLL
jgi:hypothetical protein